MSEQSLNTVAFSQEDRLLVEKSVEILCNIVQIEELSVKGFVQKAVKEWQQAQGKQFEQFDLNNYPAIMTILAEMLKRLNSSDEYRKQIDKGISEVKQYFNREGYSEYIKSIEERKNEEKTKEGEKKENSASQDPKPESTTKDKPVSRASEEQTRYQK